MKEYFEECEQACDLHLDNIAHQAESMQYSIGKGEKKYDEVSHESKVAMQW